MVLDQQMLVDVYHRIFEWNRILVDPMVDCLEYIHQDDDDKRNLLSNCFEPWYFVFPVILNDDHYGTYSSSYIYIYELIALINQALMVISIFAICIGQSIRDNHSTKRLYEPGSIHVSQ